MANKKNDDISHIVDKAIENMDFTNLSNKIQNTIDSSLSYIRNSIIGLGSARKPKEYRISKDPTICVQVPLNSSRNSALRFFGMCFLVIGMMTSFATIISLLTLDFISLIYMFTTSVAMLLFGGVLYHKGKQYANLNKRYLRYLREIDNNTVISIDDLSSAVQQSHENTVNDLIVLLKEDYFKQARLVEGNRLLLMDTNTYRLYKENKLHHAPKIVFEQEEVPSVEQLDQVDARKYEQAMEDGKYYMSSIDQLKNKIQDLELKGQVERLETNVISILNRVEADPSKIDALDRFLNYYLPTTLKLLQSFEQFEQTKSDAPEIIDAKNEIKKSFNSINSSFEQLLIQLFEDKTMDIKTDISVLKTMLKQEGLLDNDFLRKE